MQELVATGILPPDAGARARIARLLAHDLLDGEREWLRSPDGQAALVALWNETLHLPTCPSEGVVPAAGAEGERDGGGIDNLPWCRAQLRGWIAEHRIGADRDTLLLKAAATWEQCARDARASVPAVVLADITEREAAALERASALLDALGQGHQGGGSNAPQQLGIRDHVSHVLTRAAIEWRRGQSPHTFQLYSALLPRFGGEGASAPNSTNPLGDAPTTKDRVAVLEGLLALARDPATAKADTVHWLNLALKFHVPVSAAEAGSKLAWTQRACLVALTTTYSELGMHGRAVLLAGNGVHAHPAFPAMHALQLKVLVAQGQALGSGMAAAGEGEAIQQDLAHAFTAFRVGVGGVVMHLLLRESAVDTRSSPDARRPPPP